MGILDPVKEWLFDPDEDEFDEESVLEDSSRGWPSRVETKSGALRGWSKEKSAGTRHSILGKVVDRDGYGTVSKRLNFLCNVTKDRATRKAACGDLKWLQREYPED